MEIWNEYLYLTVVVINAGMLLLIYTTIGGIKEDVMQIRNILKRGEYIDRREMSDVYIDEFIDSLYAKLYEKMNGRGLELNNNPKYSPSNKGLLKIDKLRIIRAALSKLEVKTKVEE